MAALMLICRNNINLDRCTTGWACGAMDNASDYGSEDSRFDSWQARNFFLLFLYIHDIKCSTNSPIIPINFQQGYRVNFLNAGTRPCSKHPLADQGRIIYVNVQYVDAGRVAYTPQTCTK